MKTKYTFFQIFFVLVATLTSLNSSSLIALSNEETEKFGVLPFTGWRNNLLFSNAVLNRLQIRGGQDRCTRYDCGWHPHVYLAGVGEVGEGEVKYHGPKFDYNTWGIEGAADVRYSADLLVGAAFGGMANHFTWHSHGGNGTSNDYLGALYFNYTNGNYFVSGMATGGWDESTTHRKFAVSDVHYKASGHQNGASYAFHLQEGLYINLWCWQFIPMLRASFVSVHQNKFHEHGADGYGLIVRPWTTALARGYVEGKVARTFAFSACCLQPQVFIGYAYDSAIGGKHVTSYYEDSDDAFYTKLWSRNQGSFIGGAEVDMVCGYDLSGYARYEVQGNKRYCSQTGQVGVAYGF